MIETKLPRLAARIWYRKTGAGLLLWPFGKLFEGIARLRRACYRCGWLKTTVFPVPVIVVGNLTVGGAGKTPLIIWLARFLKEKGFRPGIVSRGYGGRAALYPQWVDADSRAGEVGDEALLIAARTGCPMAVSPVRTDACRLLLDRADCDVLLSDDGLQHYALGRTLEIAVIDGERRFGNGWCLPAGPLREPEARLKDVDLIVVNGGLARPNEFSMQLAGAEAVNLLTGMRKPLAAFKAAPCHAVAGIGHPERFFRHLEMAGLGCIPHDFPDHFAFRPEDLDFGDTFPVLMTEKDAVKCGAFADERLWAVPVEANMDSAFAARLIELLSEKHDR
ncbi:MULTISPECIES: tetraacyldisaccharide 4'-kinase [Methylomicrobium]|uniref:Tetraacyldisaccharide 4'-kinase n=1 Tax=Methylomicrobium album BG8 TaxID=686340 RepID=H8GGK3_METAL|nr:MULTISPECIES: tetraacyldisaccharide 4'-kinase [Methylomicrobium]EIC28799.1 tetraacyldisaccharide 4''-kinase [Methylomicrobium album BG8]